MVRRIQGTIDYEKHSETLNDNHKVLIYLDDMTLTGKLLLSVWFRLTISLEDNWVVLFLFN